jgi:GT2 family glycosyltransferase
LRQNLVDREAQLAEAHRTLEQQNQKLQRLARQVDVLFKSAAERDSQLSALKAERDSQVGALRTETDSLRCAKAEIGRLGATVEALRKSISWRVTAPLRELLRSADRLRRILWPRSYQFALHPAAQLTSVNPERKLWQAQGSDQQFLLIPNSGHYPTRWCEVLISIKGLDDGQRPLLRADDGGGLAESSAFTLPPPTNGEARAVVELPRFICGLRLDPGQGSGRFEINRVVIREISRKKAKQLKRLFEGKLSAASARQQSADRDADGLERTSTAAQPSARGGTPGPDVKALVRERLKAELAAFFVSGAELVLPQPQSPLTSIALVLYNQAELTYNCLCSIVAHAGPDSEVIIIDNASTDATAELLKRVHGAVVVRNAENRYFPAACNQAAEHARGKYLLLLNNDAQLLPGSLRAAVDVLEEDENVGAVGGRILTLSGRLQEAGSIVWSDGSTLGYGRGDLCDRPQYMFRREVDFCSGAFLLTHTRLFSETGGFDEIFSPGYYEEVDFCLRLWKQGFRVVYEPRAVIVHFEYGSSDSTFASTVTARNRGVICSRHADYLSRREPPAHENELRARYARLPGLRILFIDDRIPHRDQGSGYPRANAIANAMMRMGAAVTLFPAVRCNEPWQQVYRDLPREIEVMVDASADSLPAFLRERRGEYDAIFVSRPHNMRCLLGILGDKTAFNGCRLIYDAEAVFALRKQERARVLGDGDPEPIQHELAEELELAARADQIVCVSEAERRHFVERGLGPAYILGHSLEVNPSTTTFENRYDILFVGAMHGPDSPNEDSVLWFAKSVLPLVCAGLASENVRFLVVGQNTVQRLSALASDPSVELIGSVEDLFPYYERARIFIAPTRFAAGIPLKILEAAAAGVPIVATTLIAAELGWAEGKQLLTAPATEPEKFANECVRLYSDKELWSRLREEALARVSRDCTPAHFADTLKTILTEAGERPRATAFNNIRGDRGDTQSSTD